MNIPFDVIGKIVSGQNMGHYIKVIDDKINTGGYLVLMSSDFNFTTGYDDWLENLQDLNKYFLDFAVEWSR